MVVRARPRPALLTTLPLTTLYTHSPANTLLLLTTLYCQHSTATVRASPAAHSATTHRTLLPTPYCYSPHYSCHCQRISDTDKHTRERAAAASAATSARAARAAAAATDAEEAQAAAAQVEVVPAGTRRACFHAGMSYVRDKVRSA